MADVIFEHAGTLDKFMGDAILAVFGAPFDQPDHGARCVRTAQAMRRALAAFNSERSQPPLQLRIGICSGTAMTGDIGSPKRREYTVLGDVVNVASRIESNIARPGQIVIARSTYDRLESAIAARSLGHVTLRGRGASVEVFEVDG
jgi:class 3 adenylate cyclase